MKHTALLKPTIALLAGLGFTLQAHAGIPVVDGIHAGISQLGVAENIAQTAKQIEEYKTQIEQYTTQALQYKKQLDQYENMLKNTAAPAAYIWDQANSTISKLMEAQSMINYYTTQAGSLDSYLSKYRDTSYYKSSPCFGLGTCTEEDQAELAEHEAMASESQKTANDALFKSIKQQQENLQADSRQLERLQQAASTADGQVKAIQYANQLASQQTNQLLQLRSLMLAEQSATANRAAAELDEKARGEAQARRVTTWEYEKSPEGKY
ncbi:P-type conjugative transfer protein TrbJ [Pseudomonas kermanshahensis]|uniref:P-type conjugative transfer protein TrbJ n=1 Tax=Pseudomonas kermanshahensis TaxID=2745482 RepID=UPI0023DC2A75|nr:P-type conjugative transfer protein TrbJ [Pseudomonas kermanshahensis]WEL55652.1 P-type conjugative transfer protein TrbJ [Pseudomonas kermanshahensis]